ncbi:hypothetical protein [Burkholderia sp. S171]
MSQPQEACCQRARSTLYSPPACRCDSTRHPAGSARPGRAVQGLLP